MAKAMGPFGVPVGLGGMAGVLKVRNDIARIKTVLNEKAAAAAASAE